MKASDYSTEMLREQIVKGREWLKGHAQKFGEEIAENGEPYDDDIFQKKLRIYEDLVSEFKRRGHDEPITMNDAELIENEKKMRTSLNTAPEGYNSAYTKWFRLRDELVNRKLVPFFVPTKNEW